MTDIPVGERLAALAARGAAARAPLPFAFARALARRLEGLGGPLGERLASRLESQLARCEALLAAAPDTPAAPRSPGPLAALAASLAQGGFQPLPAAQAATADLPSPPGLQGPSLADPGAGPAELKTLRHFRDNWSKLSAAQQLAEALAQAPQNAGPLNPQVLVLRALSRMEQLAPDYLTRFMAYAETLLWLEQADDIGPLLKRKGPLRGGKTS